MQKRQQEAVSLDTSHPRVVNARKIVADVTEGKFAYEPELARSFVSTLTEIPVDGFPEDVKDDDFIRFVPHLLIAQSVVRYKRLDIAKRDVRAAHLTMQGHQLRYVASAIHSIAAVRLDKGIIYTTVSQAPKRMRDSLRNVPTYTPSSFREMFEQSMAGATDPIPFMPLPSPSRFFKL